MSCKHLNPKTSSQNLVDTDDSFRQDSIVIEDDLFANSREQRNSDDVLIKTDSESNVQT